MPSAAGASVTFPTRNRLAHSLAHSNLHASFQTSPLLAGSCCRDDAGLQENQSVGPWPGLRPAVSHGGHVPRMKRLMQRGPQTARYEQAPVGPPTPPARCSGLQHGGVQQLFSSALVALQPTIPTNGVPTPCTQMRHSYPPNPPANSAAGSRCSLATTRLHRPSFCSRVAMRPNPAAHRQSIRDSGT